MSPNNYSYLEAWLGLSNMSHNLAVSMLILAFVSVIKMVQLGFEGTIEWLFLIVMSIISIVIFLKRSIRFNNYYKADRVAAIECLNLVDKAKKID